jgi:hypothetical protein
MTMSDDMTPEEEQLFERWCAAYDENAGSVFLVAHPEFMPVLARLVMAGMEANPSAAGDEKIASLKDARDEAAARHGKKFEADCLAMIANADGDEELALVSAITMVVMRAIAIGLGRAWVARMFVAACDPSREQVEMMMRTDPPVAAPKRNEGVASLEIARLRASGSLAHVETFAIGFLKLLNRPDMNSGDALFCALRAVIERAMDLNLGREWIAEAFESASEISRVTVESRENGGI